MNERICLILIATVLVGCSSSPTPVTPSATTIILKPDNRLRGRIKSVNQQGQYAIVDFGISAVPPLQTEMNIYRDNELMGVLNLTGPARQGIVAGDIVSGEAEAGDFAIWDPDEDE